MRWTLALAVVLAAVALAAVALAAVVLAAASPTGRPLVETVVR
jgi:hypothetical protein